MHSLWWDNVEADLHCHMAKQQTRPSRTGHFFASSDKAKRELGWQPQHTFVGDADALVEAYKASGREEKEIDFSVDDKILAGAH